MASSAAVFQQMLQRNIGNFTLVRQWMTKNSVHTGTHVSAVSNAAVSHKYTGASNERFLKNKVALITGSTSGIGLGIARAMASRGCDIVITGLGDANSIAKVQEDLSREFGGKVLFGEGDLAKVSGIEAMYNQITRTFPEGIDILINNAGFQHVSPIDQFPTDKWDAMIAVMLTAPFHLMRLSLPGMRKKGWGRIINVGSVHGLFASPYKAAYIAAKHGVVGLTKNVALETAGQGVTCNAICPGYVDTPLYQAQVKVLAEKDRLSYDDAQRKFLSTVQPSGKSVPVDDVAELAVFLCTNAASQITGSCQVMDGGWSAK